MGINYSIDAEARIVRLDYVSESSADEFRATMRAIFRSTNYRPGFGFLVDRRNVAVPTLEDYQHVIAFMALNRDALLGCRWAPVVGDEAAFAIGRMEDLLAAGASIELRVFTDIGQAERWLQDWGDPRHVPAPH